ncbi:tripartite tricarboxylate transporter substrate binding protein [Hydrogenophaga sp.]|uniref:Bug family tripartite tricarboxylate transporter substrate binding protein n=1 Tax=Hydrogenophaga sp. TaxID=1904254 RepID=UPI00260FA868|nr:tripartite tricarboxylate transporter substrate binding protein [Hydrogenophaga sp.]MCW5654874.1 tripartite tricarboxylate transporter substrate binding protein [Hydrogenophaga sp.]
MKRLPFRFLAALLAALNLATAHAQSADTRPVSLVVPFQAGGQLDAMARFYALRLADSLGNPVVVENKPGAAGTLAATFVARAAADGKTLFLTTGAALTIAPYLRTSMPYDAKTAFTPLAMIADMPMSLAVRADSPFKTVADVLQTAKVSPGGLTVATTGVGAISHLVGELFAQAAGVKFTFVPYQGIGSIRDLLGGQVPLIITSSTSLESQVQAGQVRILATFSSQRLPSANGAPTMAEATGIKGLEVPVWTGLMAPAKLPPAVAEKLTQQILATCKDPETTRQFKEIVACAGPAEFDRVIKEDAARWEQTIRKANLKIE